MFRIYALAMALPLVCGLLMFSACLSGETLPGPFTIAWSYDTSGYLETCGCSSHQLGGLTRRATKLAELRASGPLMAIEGAHIIPDKGEFNLFKGQTIVAALNSMHYDALILGVREAQLGHAGLEQLTSKATFPCICANLRIADQPWGTPSAKVEVAGGQVGLIGVSQPEAVSFELEPGTSFSDPAAALQASLPELSDCAIVVICLEGDLAWIKQIQMQFQGQNRLFLSGDRKEASATLEFGNDPPWLNNFDRGRYLGLITVDPAPVGYSFAGVNLGLSDQLEDAPDIRTLLDNDFKPRLKEFFPLTKESLKQLFMPPEYCGDCHKAAYAAYQKTGHSIALHTLEEKGQTYNPDCMKCHVNYDPKEDKLYSMTCVMCHSNITEDHVWQATADPKSVVVPETPVTTYTYDWCYRCHDPLNSTNFEAHWPQYVNKIYHGGDISEAQAAAVKLGINMADPPPAHE